MSSPRSLRRVLAGAVVGTALIATLVAMPDSGDTTVETANMSTSDTSIVARSEAPANKRVPAKKKKPAPTTTSTSTTSTPPTTAPPTTAPPTTAPPTTAPPTPAPPPPPPTTAPAPPPPPTTAPAPAPAPPPPPAPPAGVDTSCESTLLAKVNQARSNHGLSMLGAPSAATSVARQWSAHMASVDRMYHNPNMLDQVLSLLPLTFIRGNVGHASGPVATADALFDALMNSPTHRDNILHPDVTQMSAGCIRDGDHLWITQNFWG